MGRARRDFTYIDDIIQGVVASIRSDGAPFDIFNLGESETIELSQVIAEIESRAWEKGDDQPAPTGAGRHAGHLRRYLEGSAAPGLRARNSNPIRCAKIH